MLNQFSSCYPYTNQNIFISFYYFALWPTNAQSFHKLSHSYMFRHYRVILRDLLISTLPVYLLVTTFKITSQRFYAVEISIFKIFEVLKFSYLCFYFHFKISKILNFEISTNIVRTCRIFRPIRRIFPPRKMWHNSTCVLYAEGKEYFQTCKCPYIYYTTSLSWDSENNHEDDFSGSDDDFLDFYVEQIILWLLILVCNNPVFFQ